QPAGRLRQRNQLVPGTRTMSITRTTSPNLSVSLPAIVLALALSGCATNRTYIPPEIDYDDMTPAVLTVDPPAPVQVVELPTPLPLPGQLRPLDAEREPDDRDPADRVLDANEEAR